MGSPAPIADAQLEHAKTGDEAAIVERPLVGRRRRPRGRRGAAQRACAAMARAARQVGDGQHVLCCRGSRVLLLRSDLWEDAGRGPEAAAQLA